MHAVFYSYFHITVNNIIPLQLHVVNASLIFKEEKSFLISLQLGIIPMVSQRNTYDLQSMINVQGFLGFAGNLRAQKPNKSQTKQAKIMGVKYFRAYQQVVSILSCILYSLFILLPHYLQQLTFCLLLRHQQSTPPPHPPPPWKRRA